MVRTGALSDGRRRILPRTAPAFGGPPVFHRRCARGRPGTGPCDGVLLSTVASSRLPAQIVVYIEAGWLQRLRTVRDVGDGSPTIARRASATLPLTFGVLRVLCHYASTVRSSPTVAHCAFADAPQCRPCGTIAQIRYRMYRGAQWHQCRTLSQRRLLVLGSKAERHSDGTMRSCRSLARRPKCRGACGPSELLKRLQMDPIGWLHYPHILGCAHGHRGRRTLLGRSRVLLSTTAESRRLARQLAPETNQT